MSKANDRARAESGLIFRDGGLVNKEEWNKAHPTHEMLKERQAGVDKAVEELMAAKKQGGRVMEPLKDLVEGLDPKDTDAVMAESEPYFCTRCIVIHHRGKIFAEHRQYDILTLWNGAKEKGVIKADT